ncbi:hypothetical protein BOTBODRAFT_176812 [Botryobasidium botryosum FD-172 SS1]|uniref:Uncharacterized protein n=1 Tax=Botryobasidium botryosum (strain FD-172 SS1) TaxID=930990 RepID=A0A067MKE5_BOTB1|nr:hypothetical protein BOTBODRAFT_176812 [Botryobasidium botryosum FD-172 SS1]
MARQVASDCYNGQPRQRPTITASILASIPKLAKKHRTNSHDIVVALVHVHSLLPPLLSSTSILPPSASPPTPSLWASLPCLSLPTSPAVYSSYRVRCDPRYVGKRSRARPAHPPIKSPASHIRVPALSEQPPRAPSDQHAQDTGEDVGFRWGEDEPVIS